MHVPEAQIKSQYQMHASKGNWFVNSKVRVIAVAVLFQNVPPDDVDRLYVRHASANTFQANITTASGPLIIDYQEAPEFGQRAVKEIRDAANRVLRLIRDCYGQYWIGLLSVDEDKPQNFLDEIQPSGRWRSCVADRNGRAYNYCKRGSSMISRLFDELHSLEGTHFHQAADASLVAQLEGDHGIALPSDHKDALKLSNGVEAYGGYFRLFGGQ